MPNEVAESLGSVGSQVEHILDAILAEDPRKQVPIENRSPTRPEPAASLLLARKDIRMLARTRGLLLLLVLPSSTAVDRLALYIMPLQIAVLSRLPLILGRRLGVLIVVLYSVAIEFVWLNFATHARFWIPYQVYPLF